jgi:hypothetical protein
MNYIIVHKSYFIDKWDSGDKIKDPISGLWSHSGIESILKLVGDFLSGAPSSMIDEFT